MLYADLCLELYWNVSVGFATSIYIASKCLWGVIKTHIWAGRAINICWIHFCVLSRNVFGGSQENNWSTVCAFFYFHIYPWRAITVQRACQLILNPSFVEPIYCGLCLLLCLYQSELRNYIRLFGFLLLKWSHTAVQAQGLQGVSEGTNCQGYVSADDWCGARLFLSACQVAGMFNVLIIGCSVVYISLSAPLSHLNCQSTSKACRSSVFLLTPWMFSLSWVLVICYDLRASWQTGLL